MDNFCKPICCCCSFDDNVNVNYFDREPYAIKGCCCPSVPKLEILDPGYMCCCVKLDCECIFGPKQVVIMPFESCCMGLCANRTNCCHNTCGLCGAPNGNPIIFNSCYCPLSTSDAADALSRRDCSSHPLTVTHLNHPLHSQSYF